ncbi:Asp-tRNA(Asn)/Glu-tRNA(Gln) amidotransferase subunit GatC [Aquibaculum sediminis]|uniref:Asp-tRNA(Asn)/Glu-tRNA(Gln) amidotransferase subunit GatC n=1 Tax=Aquibaculum sediminis TaxID=3231907 RepID=UPI003453232C
MSVNLETVRHIAKLARVRVEPAQAEALVGELNNILGWVEQLGELDTKDVPPMTSVVERGQPLREDQVTEGGDPEPVLCNAPDSAHGFFVVPKVVE